MEYLADDVAMVEAASAEGKGSDLEYLALGLDAGRGKVVKS
jgi:hypothetical protein